MEDATQESVLKTEKTVYTKCNFYPHCLPDLCHTSKFYINNVLSIA